MSHASDDISFRNQRLADNRAAAGEGLLRLWAIAMRLADGAVADCGAVLKAATVVTVSIPQDPVCTGNDVSGGSPADSGTASAKRGKWRPSGSRSADVSLAPDRPSRTSILNAVPARVERHSCRDAQVNIVVGIGIARPEPDRWPVSRERACETLRLRPGQDVYAQVKADRLIAVGNYNARDKDHQDSKSTKKSTKNLAKKQEMDLKAQCDTVLIRRRKLFTSTNPRKNCSSCFLQPHP